MEAKLEFLRKGLAGEIYGLLDNNGLVIRQYPAKSPKEAFDFFLTQREFLTKDDGVTSIVFEGKVVNL